jgi:hypothetical protein
VIYGVFHEYSNQDEEQQPAYSKHAHPLAPDSFMVWYKAFAGLAQPQIKVHVDDEHSTKQDEEQDAKR